MIVIDDKIISDELLENEFTCNLNACKGACCVEGDTGAPLEDAEAEILKRNMGKIKPFMTDEGWAAIEAHGVAVMIAGELKTPLMEDKACAFTVYENGTAHCGIERAHNAGAIDFLKPLSCHLYPVRIKRYADFEAVNYSRWNICNPACSLGKYLQMPVYKFVKTALVRKYGVEFYERLDQESKLRSQQP